MKSDKPWNGEMKLQDARAPPTPKDEPSLLVKTAAFIGRERCIVEV